MEKTMIKSFWLLILCGLTLAGYAQPLEDSADLYRVETSDGNEYLGTIISEDSLKLQLQTENLGILNISRAEIVRIYPVSADRIKEGKYWFDNPQSTRYLWAPNGYGLKAGEAYYQNIWVLFNQVGVGIADYFSIGVGAVPLFLFGGVSTPIWFTPKFSIPVVKDKFNVGVGALLATVIGEESTGFGLLYGIATAGSRDKNISLGLGYGFAGGEMAKSPTLSISSMIRVSPRGYFLTENYYIDLGMDEHLIFLSAGYRWIIKRAGLDFSLFMPLESSMETFILIPWIGITIPFGNRKQ